MHYGLPPCGSARRGPADRSRACQPLQSLRSGYNVPMPRLSLAPSGPGRWWLRFGRQRDDDAPRPGEVFFTAGLSQQGGTSAADPPSDQTADESALRRRWSAVLRVVARRPGTGRGTGVGSLLLFDPSPFASTSNGHSPAGTTAGFAEDSPPVGSAADPAASATLEHAGDSSGRRRRQARGAPRHVPTNSEGQAGQH
jgi:hypothetical protein